MSQPNHQPKFIPQIGVPEKTKPEDKVYARALRHKATSPGFFGVIVLCFFMSFIDIKCGGQLVDTYSGIDIVRGKEDISVNNAEPKSSGGDEIIPVRQSAYHQFQKAKEMYAWKSKLKENYEEHIDDGPAFEDDFSGMDDFVNLDNTSWRDITSSPYMARLLTIIAFISALAGFFTSFIQGKLNYLFQIIFGASGFISAFLLQIYIKATLPTSTEGDLINPTYSAPLVTVEFAIGYWLVLFLFLAITVLGFLKRKFLTRHT